MNIMRETFNGTVVNGEVKFPLAIFEAYARFLAKAAATTYVIPGDTLSIKGNLRLHVSAGSAKDGLCEIIFEGSMVK